MRAGQRDAASLVKGFQHEITHCFRSSSARTAWRRCSLRGMRAEEKPMGSDQGRPRKDTPDSSAAPVPSSESAGHEEPTSDAVCLEMTSRHRQEKEREGETGEPPGYSSAAPLWSAGRTFALKSKMTRSPMSALIVSGVNTSSPARKQDQFSRRHALEDEERAHPVRRCLRPAR